MVCCTSTWTDVYALCSFNLLLARGLVCQFCGERIFVLSGYLDRMKKYNSPIVILPDALNAGLTGFVLLLFSLRIRVFSKENRGVQGWRVWYVAFEFALECPIPIDWYMPTTQYVLSIPILHKQVTATATTRRMSQYVPELFASLASKLNETYGSVQSQ